MTIVDVPMTPPTNNLATIAKDHGLAAASAATIIETFEPIFTEADRLLGEAAAVNVTSADQVAEMKQARMMRLQLRDVRIQAEHARKNLKEDSLRRGKAIDGIANVLKGQVEPVESRLEEMEQFAARQEAKRKAALALTRAEALRPFADPQFYQLGEMTEEQFTELLSGLKAAQEAKKAAEKRAAAVEAMNKLAREEEERLLREENARLQAENAAKERVLAEERRAAEAARRVAEEQSRADAAARAKAEAELAEQRDAEQRRIQAVRAAARAAAMAPDKAKIAAIATALAALPLPEVSSPAAQKLLQTIKADLSALCGRITHAAANL